MRFRKITLKNHPILTNLELDFTDEDNKSVETLILAGENGTGKSTFADLVAGLIKPQQGEITLNGENINTFNNWTNSVSYLSQNYFLFEDTIQNNITLILSIIHILYYSIDEKYYNIYNKLLPLLRKSKIIIK